MNYMTKVIGSDAICPVCNQSYIMGENTNFLIGNKSTNTYEYTCSLKCFTKYCKSHPLPKKVERAKSANQIRKEKEEAEKLARTMAILNEIHEENMNRKVVYTTQVQPEKAPEKTHGNCGKVWVVNIDGCKRINKDEVDTYLMNGYKIGKVFR